jgi:hypothetical protein
VSGFKAQTEIAAYFDEFSHCNMRVAQYGCGGETNGIDHALDMLTFCRESCKQFYANSSELPEGLDLLGGVEDSVENVFGERCVEVFVMVNFI